MNQIQCNYLQQGLLLQPQLLQHEPHALVVSIVPFGLFALQPQRSASVVGAVRPGRGFALQPHLSVAVTVRFGRGFPQHLSAATAKSGALTTAKSEIISIFFMLFSFGNKC